MRKSQDIKQNMESILLGNFQINYMPSFRRHIIEQKLIKYECFVCNCENQWNGLELLLELDHIDGDKNNNKKENLRFLCPNCHSQTKNYRAKNISKSNSKTISDVDFIEALKNNKNINKTLISLGLDNSGGNYQRAKRLLKTI